MEKLKNLPIGVSDFKKIIKQDYLYVDKTEILYKLITSNEYYFLSRPRRFGKSLLISTLEEIFKGNKELFKDLWIYDSDYEWEEHYIMRIDFNEISSGTPEKLKAGLMDYMFSESEREGVELKKGLELKETFVKLITGISEKTGKKIVFLIDEYDKPIIDHIGRGEEELSIAKLNRDILKNFTEYLKERVLNLLRGLYL